MAITPEQVAFFEAFGYLQLPGYMSEELAWIEEEHLRLHVELGVEPDGERTVDIVPFIAQSEAFTALLDHPKVLGALEPLVGEDFNYIGSDGHYYADDVDYHPDGDHRSGLFVKFGMYLDRLTPETGMLRVIPGSHLLGPWRVHLYTWNHPQNRRGRSGTGPIPELREKMPAYAPLNNPGDVLIFNHNTFHGSFGGNAYRRMMAINVSRHAETVEDIHELDLFLKTQSGVYSEAMLGNPSPGVQRRLEQTVERELTLWGQHRFKVHAGRRGPRNAKT